MVIRCTLCGIVNFGQVRSLLRPFLPRMEENSVEENVGTEKVDFLHLPTEIHEQIIRYCGVGDVHSVALVNRLLYNVVRSKLRDFLIAACQNGTSLLQNFDHMRRLL